jgi:hypothetical protein
MTYPSEALPDVPAPPFISARLRAFRSLAFLANFFSDGSAMLRPARRAHTIRYDLLYPSLVCFLLHELGLQRVLPFLRHCVWCLGYG